MDLPAPVQPLILQMEILRHKEGEKLPLNFRAGKWRKQLEHGFADTQTEALSSTFYSPTLNAY